MAVLTFTQRWERAVRRWEHLRETGAAARLDAERAERYRTRGCDPPPPDPHGCWARLAAPRRS